jgi:hypothetical protein
VKEPAVRAPSVESPYLCVKEAAIYLRISERALENFRTIGGGPVYRKHGGRVVYHIGDLDAWSKAREYRHTGGADRP